MLKQKHSFFQPPLLYQGLRSVDSYRYTYNGKELDKEGLGGGGATYDYGFRIYNPQIAKFLSVDPLFKSYPWNSTYAYAENDAIRSIDLDGLEKITYIILVDEKSKAETTLGKTEEGEVKYRLQTKSYSTIYGINNTYTLKIPDPTVVYKYINMYGVEVKPESPEKKLHNYNWFESIYIGQNNPPDIKDPLTGKIKPDYSRRPLNLVDAAAKDHDVGYDGKNAKGASDAFLNYGVVEIDKKLIQACQDVIDKYEEMLKNPDIEHKDPYTGERISTQTYEAAVAVKAFFKEVAVPTKTKLNPIIIILKKANEIIKEVGTKESTEGKVSKQ